MEFFNIFKKLLKQSHGRNIKVKLKIVFLFSYFLFNYLLKFLNKVTIKESK